MEQVGLTAVVSLIILMIIFRYASQRKLDNAAVWVGLCRQQQWAVDNVIAFLRVFIQESKTRRPCLGVKESKEVRTITSGAVVQDYWRALMFVADDEVLAKKRVEDPDNAHLWTLSFYAQKRTSATPGAVLIGNVSREHVYSELGGSLCG